MGSLRGWYLTVRQGLGEHAGGGGRSMGVRAEAQLENLSQAHILLGRPVGGGGMGREEVNRVQCNDLTSLYLMPSSLQG